MACKKVVGACVVDCLGQDAAFYIAQLMPLPLALSCFCKIPIDFCLSDTGSPGSSRTKAIKRLLL